MTGKELSEGLGISQAMVSRLLKAGMPSDSLERAKRWRNRTMQRGRMKGVRLDTRVQHQPTKAAQQPPPMVPQQPSADDGDLFDDPDIETDPDVALQSYRDARSRKEHFQAELARLAFQKEAGELMLANEVRAMVATAGTELRTTLEALSYRLAVQIPGIQTEDEAQALVASHVETTLEQLAHRFESLSKQAQGNPA